MQHSADMENSKTAGNFREVRSKKVKHHKKQLKREIMEELDTEITVGKLIDTIEYEYPTFHLSMDCFWCEVVKGELVLKEAEDAKWLKKDELGEVAWLPADVELIEKIGTELGE